MHAATQLTITGQTVDVLGGSGINIIGQALNATAMTELIITGQTVNINGTNIILNGTNIINLQSPTIILNGNVQALTSFVQTKHTITVTNATTLELNQSGSLVILHTDNTLNNVILTLPASPLNGTYFDIAIKHLEVPGTLIITTNTNSASIYSLFRNKSGESLNTTVKTSVNINNLLGGDSMHIIYGGVEWYLSGSSASANLEIS
jgi:hypothetical protein